jgi:hypothetical protein
MKESWGALYRFCHSAAPAESVYLVWYVRGFECDVKCAQRRECDQHECDEKDLRRLLVMESK